MVDVLNRRELGKRVRRSWRECEGRLYEGRRFDHPS